MYPRDQAKIENLKLRFPLKEMSWYPIPGVPENYIPPNSPYSDSSQINLKCITWKNEEQGPQADSVKPEPSDIMMGTMPTQRNST